MAIKFKSKLVFGKTGVFDSIGVGVQDPGGNLHISGRDLRLTSGSAHFDSRPLVNGFPVMLSGDTVSIDVSDLYPTNNPSGFITGISNLVYTTGNQTISGVKNFTERPTLNGTGFLLIGEVAGGGGDYYPNSNPSGFITGINKDNIDLLFKSAYNTYYHELSYSTSGVLTGVNVWQTDSKTTALFSKNMYYSGDALTGVITSDLLSNKMLTKTLTYDTSGNLISTRRIYN